jgi:hypothetical protein
MWPVDDRRHKFEFYNQLKGLFMPNYSFMLSLAKLPTLEAKTIAYVELAQFSPRSLKPVWLEADGFSCYLRHFKTTPSVYSGNRLGESIVISNIYIEEEHRGKGWFWRYVQLCAFLADVLIIENVIEDALHDSLCKYPKFFQLHNKNFIFTKNPVGQPWPIAYLVDEEKEVNKAM